jgi:hypothetical protein
MWKMVLHSKQYWQARRVDLSSRRYFYIASGELSHELDFPGEEEKHSGHFGGHSESCKEWHQENTSA